MSYETLDKSPPSVGLIFSVCKMIEFFWVTDPFEYLMKIIDPFPEKYI